MCTVGIAQLDKSGLKMKFNTASIAAKEAEGQLNLRQVRSSLVLAKISSQRDRVNTVKESGGKLSLEDLKGGSG